MRPTDRRGRLRAGLLCTPWPAPGLAGGASAATPAAGPRRSPSRTTVHVTAKVVAVVDVSFTCDPFLIMDWKTGTLVESTVGHLFGQRRHVDPGVRDGRSRRGSAEFASGPSAIVVCDGVTLQTRSVTIMASTLPWKSGAAVANARVKVFSDDFSSTGHRRQRPGRRETRQVTRRCHARRPTVSSAAVSRRV